MVTDLKTEMLWETVFREATESNEYWSTTLTEAAMVYMSSRGLHGTTAPRRSRDSFGPTIGKRDWTQATADNSTTGAIKRQGLMLTDHSGNETFLSYNGVSCKDPRRAHVREHCLGEHRSADKVCAQSRKGQARASTSAEAARARRRVAKEVARRTRNDS